MSEKSVKGVERDVTLPDVSQDEYAALMDAIAYTRDNAATSAGRIMLDQLKRTLIRHHDNQR